MWEPLRPVPDHPMEGLIGEAVAVKSNGASYATIVTASAASEGNIIVLRLLRIYR
jgi:hypothetical protein